jgi:[ribosomal protein S5]-alanine N-acetyltransferase
VRLVGYIRFVQVEAAAQLKVHNVFALIRCDRQGLPIQAIKSFPEELAVACFQSAELYQRIGFHPPWVSYVASDSGTGVGGGAFVGAPHDGLVEIAYFTLPRYQRRGYASQTARELVRIARAADPSTALRALTLPVANPSTRILERLGFRLFGHARDPDAGDVWEWRTKVVSEGP